jgi:hypothetical protein
MINLSNQHFEREYNRLARPESDLDEEEDKFGCDDLDPKLRLLRNISS